MIEGLNRSNQIFKNLTPTLSLKRDLAWFLFDLILCKQLLNVRGRSCRAV